MGLSSSYFVAPSLQMYFVDKDSGLPLTGGIVKFFSDNSRSTPKPVYELSGVPGAYTYTNIGSVITLSAVGTFQDGSGNDILPYYYPYITDSAGNIVLDLYYIEVYDHLGVLQFTREAWPNIANGSSSGDIDIQNYIPNGQFVIHDNVPASSANGFIPNQISQAVTTIAPGGWTFERNDSSTAKDFVIFTRYGSATNVPSGNPRYAVELQCTEPGSDTRKDLCIAFPNVNTFSSTTRAYNFYFEAQSIGSVIPNVQIIVIKNFGTGGTTPPVETVVTTITLNTTVVQYNTSIIFGTNEAYTIGPNNDDYVQIAIRLPPTGVQTAKFTDFALTSEAGPLGGFPTQTRAEQVAPSTAGWLDKFDPDGYDLFLPLVLTKSGVEASDEGVGMVFASVSPIPVSYLLCDGAQYRTNDYSSDGIPYARLHNKIFDTNLGLPLYGTGSNYVNTFVSGGRGNSPYLIINTNKNTSAQTNPADGTVPTNFTFTTPVIFQAATSGIGYTAWANSDSYVTARINTTSKNPLSGNGVNVGTSSFILTQQSEPTSTIGEYYFVLQVSSAASLAGKYFQFSSNTTLYYMWFTVDAVGPAPSPAPGGTEIKVALLSTMTGADVANAVSQAINKYQVNQITCTAASTITAGAWFSFYANSIQYVVWYKKDGSGSKPSVSGVDYYIEVDIANTDTAQDVTNSTQIAINSQFYATPNLTGMFLRGFDPAGVFDYNVSTRYGEISGLDPNHIGSFELDTNRSHSHSAVFHGANATGPIGPPYGAFVGHVGGPAGGDDAIPSYTINTDGYGESRPVNMFVQWMIKY